MDRAAVVKVIRDFTGELAQPASGRTRVLPDLDCKPAQPIRASAPALRVDDPGAVLAALRAACQEHGISVQQYEAALQADPSLADLERQALTTAPVEPPDPGPYDAISRESPSGQPGDLTKFRSVPRRAAPGGS